MNDRAKNVNELAWSKRRAIASGGASLEHLDVEDEV